ncbi:hypothetical protein BJV78DRAFT_1224061, partial [Lactifluus subvellereus]
GGHRNPARSNDSTSSAPPQPPPLDEPTLAAALLQLPKESVYRVKSFIRFAYAPSTSSSALAEDLKDRRRSWWILNWAFGRWELVGAKGVRLTVMEERGE